MNADLILANANVITVNGRQPAAELIAVRGDRIVCVGSNRELSGMDLRHSRVVDCGGGSVVPGFIDAHCHVMAYASSLLAVDCSPSAVSSVSDVRRALAERARSSPPGGWIRGAGYSEFDLKERRHLTRWDLDEAVPDHPAKLNHRSGHACVLNSAALARVGISRDTPDPVGGLIERDWETGEPTGLLMEMDGYLDGVVPPLGERELLQGVQMVNDRLVSRGVTTVVDATHSNSTERWDVFKRLKSEGTLAPRVTMMAGSDHLEGFLDRGVGFGSDDDDLRLGAVKIMLAVTTGTLVPSRDELRDRVLRARRAGFQVAIHAVESEVVEAAAAALLSDGPGRAGASGVMRDRIEHCSECAPALLERLADSGLVVVTQPGFLYHSGRRYLSEVAAHVQPWLYRIRSFYEAGLSPAAGSDAPVTDPVPLVGIYAAVTRRADSGETVGESQGITASQALRMWTLNGAYASFQEADKGTIEAGKLADLVLLDEDVTRVGPERIPDIKVMMTVIGGRVIWEA